MTVNPLDGITSIDDVPATGSATTAPALQFVITPHRSLSDRAFASVILAILAVAVLAQLYFLLIGIWVAGVAVLFDGLFLAAAFMAWRLDRMREETLSLRDGMLHVRRYSSNAKLIHETSMPAFGVELIETVDPDYGCRKLELRYGKTIIEVGGDLSPFERSSFRRELVSSLAERGFKPRLTGRSLPGAHTG